MCLPCFIAKRKECIAYFCLDGTNNLLLTCMMSILYVGLHLIAVNLIIGLEKHCDFSFSGQHKITLNTTFYISHLSNFSPCS